MPFFTNRAITPLPAAGYQGPGDIVGSALVWWGLRAYNNAAIGQDAVRLVRASDSAELNFVTIAGGGLDAAAIVTWRDAVGASTLKVVTLFDQTGGGKHVTQATDANRPIFVMAFLGSFPSIQFVAGLNLSLASGSGLANLSQPLTFSAVANNTTSGAALSIMGSDTLVGKAASANTGQMYAGTVLNATMSDNTWHATQAVFNGGSSIFSVDGGTTSGAAGAAGVSFTTQPFFVGSDNFASGYIGYIMEAGVWPTNFSGTQNTNMSANQHSFWGF